MDTNNEKKFGHIIYWIPHGSAIYCENKGFKEEVLFFNKKYERGFELLDKPEKYCIVVSDNIINTGSWQYIPIKDAIILPTPFKFDYNDFINRTELIFETTRSFENFKRLKNPFNPPMIIHTYDTSTFPPSAFIKGKKDKFYVFRDDLLYGGTKQRALLNYAVFMGAQNYDCVIYAGPPQGIAQVALGVICKYLNKPGIMIYIDPFYPFIQNEKKRQNNYRKFPMSCKAAKMGVKLLYGGRTLDEAQNFAQDFAKTNNGFLVPFGLDDPNFKGLLVEALCEAIPLKIRESKIVLWTIVGSGLLMNTFYEVFPNAFIIGVRAGKAINTDALDPTRTFTITTHYKFTDVPATLPPYPTVPCYDGKIWEQFAKYYPIFENTQFSKSNDIPHGKITFLNELKKREHYIWNVANEII